MFIHLMGKSMYTADTYQFLSMEFDPNENVFACFRKSKMKEYFPQHFPSSSSPKICPVVSFLEPRFWKMAYMCDGFIVHGLFSFNKVLVFLLMPHALKKTNWIVWGGDIYAHNDKALSIIGRVSEKTRRILGKRFGFITTLVDKDYSLARKWYNVTGKHLTVSYPLPLHQSGVLEKLEECKDKPMVPLKIVLGNSATESNQHFEVLELLSRFKSEDIRIYLPLSYGVGDYIAYANRVEKYAIDIFGKEKVFPIRNKMTGIEYTEFMKQMNVGIFNNNRQQGMGNINLLIACGAKVFIRDDTTMWEQYVKRGQLLHSCSEIPRATFDEFASESAERREINMSAMKKHLDKEGLIKKWENLFCEMRHISE